MPTPYSNPWDETYPDGSLVAASSIDDILRQVQIAVRERFVDILGITFPNDTVTEVTASKLVLKGAVSPKIIPGSTSLVFRNSVDSADNVTISDGGTVTISRGDVIRNATASGYFIIQGASGSEKALVLRTNTNNRWMVASNTDAESGANAGSTLHIRRYDDAGALLGTPLSIARATGIVTLTNGLVVPSGGITVTGTSGITGTLTITNAPIQITGAAGSSKDIRFQTSGNNRWIINSNNSAESGGNAGSNFNISRYDDAGVSIETAFSITRIDGKVTVTQNLTVGNGVTITSGDLNISGGNIVASSAAGDRHIELSRPAGAVGRILLRTSGSSRWGIIIEGSAESGGNVGSTFQIWRFTDAGTSIEAALSIARATGIITITRDLNVSGAGTFTGLLTANGGISITGSTTISGNITSSGLAQDRYFIATSQATREQGIKLQTSGVDRWTIISSNDAESGGNAGSDLYIKAYSDAGALLSRGLLPYDIKIRRATGDVIIASNVEVESQLNANIFNCFSTGGYQDTGLAPVGHYLRGNGTYFKDDVIQNGDLPSPLTNNISTNSLVVGGGSAITKILTNTLVWAPGSIASGSAAFTTITVTGAAVGDVVIFNQANEGGTNSLELSGWVSAVDTVTIRLRNYSAGALDPGSRTYRAIVIHI